MFLRSRTLLVAALIAANLVVTSVARSAWALSPQDLPRNALEQAELMLELVRAHARISMTRSRALSRVRDLPDRMVTIMVCEVNEATHAIFENDRARLILNGEIVTNGVIVSRTRSDRGAGVFQIMPEHVRTAQRLGLDITGDVHHYIQYALLLVEWRIHRGHDPFTDWNASRPCWSNPARARERLAMIEQLRQRFFLEIAEAR